MGHLYGWTEYNGSNQTGPNLWEPVDSALLFGNLTYGVIHILLSIFISDSSRQNIIQNLHDTHSIGKDDSLKLHLNKVNSY